MSPMWQCRAQPPHVPLRHPEIRRRPTRSRRRPLQFGDLDENDPSSVARFVKRMGEEMGEDLGDDLDAAMDEASGDDGADMGGEGDFGGGETSLSETGSSDEG